MSAKNFPPPAWQARNSMVARWKAKIDAQQKERKRQRQERDTKEKVAGALVADLPLEKLIRFKNPVLAREVKARFRLRRAGFIMNLLRLASFLCGTGLWLYTGFCLLDPILSDAVPTVLVFGLWISGCAFIALAASSSFARELESGTWEAIRLSLLTRREVVNAKFASPIVVFFYYTLPLWLLIPFLIKAMSIGVLLMSLVVLAVSFALVSAIGLMCSRKNRSSVAATCWTFGLLACLWGAGPWLADSLNVETVFDEIEYGLGLTSRPDESDPYGGDYYLRTSAIDFSPPMILGNLFSIQTTLNYGYNYGCYQHAITKRAWRTALIGSFVSLFLTLIILHRLLRNLEDRPAKSVLERVADSWNYKNDLA